jgi:CHAT domain-containing protein/Flp pilus assembly protein TadD
MRSFLSFPVSALTSILLLSSVVIIPGSTGISIAQQPATNSQEDATSAATRLFDEGLQLSKQGTAESRRQAIEKYKQALPLWRQVRYKTGEAFTLLSIGKVYNDLDDKQQALKYFNESLPLWQQVKEKEGKVGEASTLNNIGGVYDNLGEKQQALNYYNQSLRLSRQVDDKVGEAITLNNIGDVNQSSGDYQEALNNYYKSLELSRKEHDEIQETITLRNIGGVYLDLGGYKQALKYYQESLLKQKSGNNKAGAKILNNIGLIYHNLGYEQLENKQEAINIDNDCKVIKNLSYEQLDNKQKALKNYCQAIYSYDQSLKLSQQMDDKAQEAITRSNKGAVYNELRDYKQALDQYNQSLPLSQKVGDKRQEAVTLNNIGKVYNSLGDKQQALDHYKQSLRLSQKIGYKNVEVSTLYNIAVVERDRGNLQQALTQIKDAIKIVEGIRGQVTSQNLRTSYFASVQDYYKFYINLLMQLHKKDPSKGYNAQALHISERARARNLLELLAEANVDIRQGVDSKLVAQERNLQQQLNAAEFQRVKLVQGQYTNKQLDKIKQQIESLDFQLNDVQAQIRDKSREYATLTQGNKLDELVLTVPQIQQQVLDDNTLLLEYSLGEERSFLWVVSKTSITSYELPKGADIKAAALAFNKELLDKKDSAGIPEVGMKLSQMILAPVASQLGQKRLLFVGDGALQTIPFTVLPIPQGNQNSAVSSQANSPTPLLVQNEILTLPSASSIGVLRNKFKGRPLAPKTIAVLADPVFDSDDERLTKIPQPRNDQSRERSGLDIQIDECLNLNRLNYTNDEAKDILSLEPNPTNKFSALGFAASLTTAVKPDLSQYQIVHFATHGCVSEKNPQLSKLVLSRFDEKRQTIDGSLNLNKIYNLNLPVELVTLSACKTGLGKNVQGEGLVGLTRGFMYAGAKRVVVSLWSVNDLSTATLMKNFYQKYLEGKQNPVAAMRAAQLDMWKSGKWKAPYYWAAFTVQGEWQ